MTLAARSRKWRSSGRRDLTNSINAVSSGLITTTGSIAGTGSARAETFAGILLPASEALRPGSSTCATSGIVEAPANRIQKKRFVREGGEP